MRSCPSWADQRGARQDGEERRLMPTLVLLRHGQSQWNLENRFTGWWDVDLTDKGVEEARAAGQVAGSQGLRLRPLLHLAPDPRDPHAPSGARGDGPSVAAGDQGLAAERATLWRADRAQQGRDDRPVGEEQVKIWRRSFDVPPPPLEPDSPYQVGDDRRYAGIEVPYIGEPEGHDRAGAALL